MMPVDLAHTARSIQLAHGRVLEACRKSLEHAKFVGLLLLKAKDAVGHGHWEAWVVMNCRFTPRTASNYMRIARSGCSLLPPDETSCRAAIRALSRPAAAPRPPKLRPTPVDVKGWMIECGVTGKLEDVIRFLRVFGVRVRREERPPEVPAEQVDHAWSFYPSSFQIGNALPFHPAAGAAGAGAAGPQVPADEVQHAWSFYPSAFQIGNALPNSPGGQIGNTLPFRSAAGAAGAGGAGPDEPPAVSSVDRYHAKDAIAAVDAYPRKENSAVDAHRPE